MWLFCKKCKNWNNEKNLLIIHAVHCVHNLFHYSSRVRVWAPSKPHMYSHSEMASKRWILQSLFSRSEFSHRTVLMHGAGWRPSWVSHKCYYSPRSTIPTLSARAVGPQNPGACIQKPPKPLGPRNNACTTALSANTVDKYYCVGACSENVNNTACLCSGKFTEMSRNLKLCFQAWKCFEKLYPKRFGKVMEFCNNGRSQARTLKSALVSSGNWETRDSRLLWDVVLWFPVLTRLLI